MSHTGWGNYKAPKEGPFAGALSYILLVAGFFYLDANLNNLLLKIIFAVIFYGGIGLFVLAFIVGLIETIASKFK